MPSNTSPVMRAMAQKRARCAVCVRRGVSGWMGNVFHEADDPNRWVWQLVDGRTGLRSPRLDSGNRNTGRRVSVFDGTSLGLHCSNRHRLAPLDPETMTGLLADAESRGRTWVVIPE